MGNLDNIVEGNFVSLNRQRRRTVSYGCGCGTGWSNELSRELRKLLERMATRTPAVILRRKAAVLVEPVLVAEVEYRGWTDDGKLRHATFKGIRPKEDDAAVFEIPVADQPKNT
ncbi:hypothetical protein [Sinorhizobium medicae]|uniref:ATP dependent DNA ligase n=1 Tax=Sinorhizobium medicae TaxID=110321 RepID=UPI00307DD501